MQCSVPLIGKEHGTGRRGAYPAPLEYQTRPHGSRQALLHLLTLEHPRSPLLLHPADHSGEVSSYASRRRSTSPLASRTEGLRQPHLRCDWGRKTAQVAHSADDNNCCGARDVRVAGRELLRRAREGPGILGHPVASAAAVSAFFSER